MKKFLVLFVVVMIVAIAYVIRPVVQRTAIVPNEATDESLDSTMQNKNLLPKWEFNPNQFIGVTAISCVSSLYTQKTQYDLWKKRYGDAHPEYRVYDAGSLCTLSNGMQLVTFAYFKQAGTQEGSTVDSNSAGQSITVFDINNGLIQETKDLFEKTLGDFTAPHIDTVRDGKVQFSFSSGDGGVSAFQGYELNLHDFTFVKKSIQ